MQTVSVRELPTHGGFGAMPGRLERTGPTLTVYRPGSNLSVPANPALNSLNTARTFSRSPGSGLANRPAGRFVGPASGFSPVGSAPSANRLESRTPLSGSAAGSRPETRHFSTPAPARAPAEPFRSRSPSASVRSVPTLGFQPSYSWRAAPSWSLARPSAPSLSYRSVPSWSAPHATFARPSYSGHSFTAPSFAGRVAPSFGGGRSASVAHGGRGFGRR